MKSVVHNDVTSDEAHCISPNTRAKLNASKDSFDNANQNANFDATNLQLLKSSESIAARDSNAANSFHSSSRDTAPRGQVVSVSSSPKLLAVYNSSDKNEEQDDGEKPKISRRRNRSVAGVDEEMKAHPDDETDVSQQDKVRTPTPQHETTVESVDSTLAPSSFHRFDSEFETALLMQRNKRVLLSRLLEVAPRGRLSVINLCRRGIGADEARLLKEAILRNPQLCVLKLSYNNLCDTGAAIIASSLIDVSNHRHHQLSVLDLGFNSIGDIGCGYLAVHCVAGNHNLQSLYLSGNQIGEKGALSIAGAILHGTSLQSLYLSANQIGPMGIKTIAGAIVKNESKIMTMRLETNSQQYRSMEVLHFGSTSMTSAGFIAIPGMLLSNSSLRALCISDNNLDDQDMLVLSQALTQNKLVPLESLCLSFNEITCVGIECLMNALWGSKTLRELKLDNNNMQDRGAQLCAVVLTSISLEILDISFNKVSTVGIKALMKNLSENTSLRTLSLSGVPIDQNASKAVSYALAYNTSLKALHVDNCSTGYASQRHIVAGVVSNRKSALRILTGFNLSPIAMTLGMPRLPEEWSNDQVLGFFRLMWDQWLLKSRQGSGGNDDESIRGPAPPAAVAAAAKIAFASLGHVLPTYLFRTEQHQKQISERSPVEPAGTALLERSDSGTMRVPLFTVSSEIGLSDFVDGEAKAAAINNNSPSPQLATVRSPLDNPERRNRNLQWLRLHFRALSDVGRLPFNNADLWQLHQYYFSPPIRETSEDPDSDTQTSSGTSSLPSRNSSLLDRSISFQSLGDAVAASGVRDSNSHKRRSDEMRAEEIGHAAKRPKNLKPRIAYYPRVMSKIHSLGTRLTSESLSLLRQLKYAESVIFNNRNPYSEVNDSSSSDLLGHSDIDMILLDLM